MTEKRIDQPTGTEFVGHEWDGIEELDTPMPRWWLWTLYATIVFSAGYIVAYPALPSGNEAQGLLGWSSKGELTQEIAADETRKAGINRAIAQTPVEALPSNPQLMAAAVEGGRAAFRVHCVQCHGTGAAGTTGYPNLNDDDWIWGGDIKAIHLTLLHGIRQPGNDATRMSMMPAFGHDQILTKPQIEDVASHVRVLSKQEAMSASAQRGAALFSANCAVCHGDQGKGDRTVGAPNLTDGIWLYGGTRAAIVNTISNSHSGVMPAWGQRLSPVTIKMLAAYVHSLGGGENKVIPATAPAPAEAKAADVKS